MRARHVSQHYGDRPEPASNDVGGITRVPPVTPHLAGISTRGLDMQSVYGARDFGYKVGPLAREDQCLDEQDQPFGPHQTIDHRFRVGLRRYAREPPPFSTRLAMWRMSRHAASTNRLIDLNGETNSLKRKKSSATIVADGT